MKRIIITHAVKEEEISLTAENSLIHSLRTGIGKVKSAVALAETIYKSKPHLVLNVGTAGTSTHQIGDIFVVSRFIDRDYEAAALPGVEFEISGNIGFDRQKLTDLFSLLHIRTAVCSTGDTFVTKPANLCADVVDMEAYAQAYTCKTYGVPFISVKYVTDIIGENSVAHWQDKLADARCGLTTWFEENQLIDKILDLEPV